MIKAFRFKGDNFADVEDMTQPDCVPTLETIVNRALAGVGTGLGQSVFDESDTDLNMMDRLDREAMRQDTERRITMAQDDEMNKQVEKKEDVQEASPVSPPDENATSE